MHPIHDLQEMGRLYCECLRLVLLFIFWRANLLAALICRNIIILSVWAGVRIRLSVVNAT